MARARAPVNEPEFVALVRRTIDERGLLKGGEHVVLAVSGGPDSLALLHSFVRIAPALSLTLHVAHFDHRLRADSGDDARFVQRRAARLKIPFTLGVADSAEPIRGHSPEEAARARRLRFLAETARALGATRIATGHTMDDQAETVLMRMLVGAGRRGLSGIPPRRWYYIRPLIDARRAQVEAFCRALRLKPRIDPTNADPAYLRNLLRTQTLPHLKETLNARLVESLARLADIVRDEDYYLDRQASAVKPEEVEGGSRLSIDALRALDPALQRRAIRLLARNEGPGIDHAHTEAVRRLALEAQSGKEIHLPGLLSARVEYGFLLVGRPPSPPAATSPIELTVPGETDLPPFGIAMRTWFTDQRPAEVPDGRVLCVLDADRVSLPLRARRVRPGDRFRPLGMSREKKVGDFFTDEKVPRQERARVPVLTDRRGIVWLAGHRVDDRAKVGARTRRFLWLAVEEGTT